MIRIVSDTSTLYSSEEGLKKGLIISPLIVSIKDKTYMEFDEISPLQFLEFIKEGYLAKTSQPSIGDKMDIYDRYSDDEVIDICIADGLSGAYQSALMAKNDRDNIHVINTATLCGPHRYIVDKALKLRDEGKNVHEIIESINDSIKNHVSFLIPEDFDYLKRGGRLTSAAATVGSLLKLVPIMTQTKDGTKLEKYGIKKTFKGALAEIASYFEKHHMDNSYHFTIVHADNMERALKAKEFLKEKLNIESIIYELSPVFISHGGPGCIAIQAIKK